MTKTLTEKQEQQEANTKDVGKLCWFWNTNEKDKEINVLYGLYEGKRYMDKKTFLFNHCRPLTKEEIKEFMEKAE